MTTTTDAQTQAPVGTPIVITEIEVKPKRARANRKTFQEVRQSEQAKYEALMQELADEVNALKEQLDAERETLAKVRGSWLTALRYRFKGHV